MWKLSVGIIYPTLIVLITGCSALLDPYNCESDGDCNGGVCVDGICVGEERQVDQMTTADAMGMVDSAVQPDANVGDDAGVLSDMSMEPDVAPDMSPDMAVNSSPTCRLVVANELTRETHVDVVIEVADEEEAANQLSVTLNGTALNLNQAGRYEGRFPLEEGPNTAELRVLDSAGAECVANASIVRDSTDPILQITSPQQLQDILTNEPQLRVQGRIDDEHFQPSLILNLDQQPIEPIEPIIWDGQSFEFVIALESGFQTLAVSTVDIPGNQSETIEITIELDEQPPVIILEQPNPDAVTVAAERRFQVRGSLQDNGRPVRNPSIEIQVESSDGLIEYPPVRGNIAGEFSQFVELGNGDNTVTVCGQDEAGNESCASGVVTKNAPCVNVESPIDGAFIGSDRIVIEGSVCEGVVQLRGAIGNGAPVDGALLNGLRFRLELPSQGEGEQEVLVTASNVDGDAATATVRVTVDSSSPTVTFRTPEANQCVGSEFTVIGTATDLESGVALVTVNGERVDNVGLDNMGGEFRQDITVRAGERDGQEVLVVATNRAGLTAETSTFVQVDTVAPQVTFDILNVNTPINPWLRPDGTGRVNFTGTVEVGQCGIAQGGFSVPGLVPSLDNEGRFTLRGVFEDGQHNLAWRIEDIVGNVRDGNYGFRVDSTPPSVEFTSPVNDTFQQADSVRLAGTVTDVGSGVQQITVNGLSINFSAAANGATFDTQLTDLIEGPNVFRVVIRDDVGNETVETFTVNRDSSAPEIAITEPNIGVAVPLPLTVTGTYSDDRTQPDNQVITGIGLETITVNGVVASIDEETGTWTAYGVVVDPEDPILTVSARDRIGNESLELERSVRVQDYGYQAPSVDGIDLAVDPTYVDVADLNQDGRVDIIAVTASENGASATFVQGSNGGFTGYDHGQALLPATTDGAIAVGDVDSDGRQDLVVVDSERTQLLLGNGNGQFIPSPVPLASLGSGVRGVLGDGTRDGRLDLILSDGDVARYYFGDGDTVFSLADDLPELGLGALGSYARLAMKDVDGDGVADIVGLDPVLGGQVWMGNRDNTFTQTDGGEWFGAVGYENFVWLDADRNGTLDIFVFGGNQNAFYLNDGNGAFVQFDLGQISTAAGAVVGVADLTGDTRDDLIVGDVNGSQIYENGPVGFSFSNTILPQFGAVQSLRVADIDSDGDFDIIIGTSNHLRIIRSNRRQLNPDHQFVHVQAYRKRNPEGIDPPLPFENHQDGIGTRAFIQYLNLEDIGDPNIAAEPLLAQRTVDLNATIPTLITLGDRAGLRLKMVFTDTGNQGQNTRTFNDILPEQRPLALPQPALTGYAPE